MGSELLVISSAAALGGVSAPAAAASVAKGFTGEAILILAQKFMLSVWVKKQG